MNIVYNASAGTGKTFQVTNLYVQLVVEEGIDPCDILLMTFTENAASELRFRVSQQLLKARRSAETEGDYDLAERVIQAISRLPAAPIGTIHSYCTRLLREHALDAGLSPGFTVLTGDERDDLLNQICRDELLNRLKNDSDLKDFCSGTHIIGSGGGFGSSITETVPSLIGQAGSLGISLEQAESMLPDPVPGASRSQFESICKRIRDLPRITPSVQTALDILEKSLMETQSAEDLVERMAMLGIKKFGRGDVNVISHDLWDLKESVENAVKYKARFPAAKAFARYVQAVATKFQQRKHEIDAVDFDDQLRMAAVLLEEGKAKPKFQYVIVDEVQDTSRIQCQLIQSLRSEDCSLVICGDKKQSIYTWRGADPQVMPDLEKTILKDTNGVLKNLQTSYRSKAPIIDVINALFESIYDATHYSSADRLTANADFLTPEEKSCVEFLANDLDEELDKQEKVAAEMEAVANRINLLVKGSSKWQPAYRYNDGFLPSHDSNAYQYSDILILLRRTSHQAALEQALRHAGIRYTLGGKGRGLFTRQETRDVSLFLNVITNPADAFSLIGFLRSPWVGLSDETIAELAYSGNGFSIDNILKNYSTETDIVERYRSYMGTKLASELVRKLIDETGYDALLAGLPRGEQKLGNLRKVLDWLRETERGAYTTPATVARKLADRISIPPNVPEAALLDPAQNAVTIMTVHGSKGLTKRVVMVPDISFRPDSDRGFTRVFLDSEKLPQLGIRITAPDKTSVDSPGFKEAKAVASTVRTHELNNLLYVALTRARDLVVMSASFGQKPEGWLKQIEPLLGEIIPTIPYSDLQIEECPAIDKKQQTPTAEILAALLQTVNPSPESPLLQRMPATRLAHEQDPIEDSLERQNIQTFDQAAAMGSLGHAVLEQLALNGWEGSVSEWLNSLRSEFGLSKASAMVLAERLQQTKLLMQELTQNTTSIHPEFAFVLHDNNRLIDGSIDLLCCNEEGCAIYDYKFTEASDTQVIENYRGQMMIYSQAVDKILPAINEKTTQLIVISESAPRIVPLVF